MAGGTTIEGGGWKGKEKDPERVELVPEDRPPRKGNLGRPPGNTIGPVRGIELEDVGGREVDGTGAEGLCSMDP